jgi:hypothetical protein
MPVYARSDVLSVTVSRAHAGCGEVHRRPITPDGTPARTWRLDCPACQGHLSHDPLWSGNEGTVPATPDETTAVENSNTLFSRNRDDIMTMALARLAGLPEGMMLRGGDVGAAARQALVKCPDGHENFPGTKFCGECGERMDGQSRDVTIITDAPEKPARQPRQPRLAKDTRVPSQASAEEELRNETVRRPVSLEDELLNAPSI